MPVLLLEAFNPSLQKVLFIAVKGNLTKVWGHGWRFGKLSHESLALLEILFIALNNGFFTAAPATFYLHCPFSLKVSGILHVCTALGMLKLLSPSGVLGNNLINDNNNKKKL